MAVAAVRRKNHGLRENRKWILKNKPQHIGVQEVFCLSTKIVDKSVHGPPNNAAPGAPLRGFDCVGDFLTSLKYTLWINKLQTKNWYTLAHFRNLT